MKKRIAKQLFCFTYFFGFTTLLLSRTAFAYLDPATTSYLIQVVAGVFIAGPLAAIMSTVDSMLLLASAAITQSEKHKKSSQISHS